MRSSEAQMPFDRIVLSKDSTEREIGIDDFMAIDLPERMQIILERRVSFYLGKQQVLSIKALRALYNSYRSAGC